jgi:hypothetical protein
MKSPGKPTRDPIEAIVEDALRDADISYTQTHPTRLDFHLPDHDLFIEVKQFHSPRIADQMSRAPNVIAIQGRMAAEFFAALIRG